MVNAIALSILAFALCLLLGFILFIVLRRRRYTRQKQQLTKHQRANDHQHIDFSVPIPRKISFVSPNEGKVINGEDSIDSQDLINPELYKERHESKGDGSMALPGSLCFSVQYEANTEKLIVGVIRGQRIRGRKSSTLTATPCVKVCLLPDKRKKVQTKARQKTPHPLFNEEFVFHCPASELRSRTLRFTVCDFDRFSRQNAIGTVLFSLDDHYDMVTSSEGCVETWRDLVEDSDVDSFSATSGELLLSLQYLPAAMRLAVVILKGKGFELDGSGKSISLYVKMNMITGGKAARTRKTTRKDSMDLVFNESFHFDIPGNMVERTSLMLSVFNHKTLIGRVVVGPFLYATGSGLAHWEDMLKTPRNAVAMWHSLF